MRRLAAAWILLSLALGLHVADEALTDFLSVYNPTVQRIRESLPWLPLPVFTFDVWLGGLVAAVVILLLLSRCVFLGQRWTITAALVLGFFMTLNALGHFAGSIVLQRAMPGVYSSPFLLAAAVNLIYRANASR